jgi:hypothetical protein
MASYCDDCMASHDADVLQKLAVELGAWNCQTVCDTGKEYPVTATVIKLEERTKTSRPCDCSSDDDEQPPRRTRFRPHAVVTPMTLDEIRRLANTGRFQTEGSRGLEIWIEHLTQCREWLAIFHQKWGIRSRAASSPGMTARERRLLDVVCVTHRMQIMFPIPIGAYPMKPSRAWPEKYGQLLESWIARKMLPIDVQCEFSVEAGSGVVPVVE